jgi:hypothetical protein
LFSALHSAAGHFLVLFTRFFCLCGKTDARPQPRKNPRFCCKYQTKKSKNLRRIWQILQKTAKNLTYLTKGGIISPVALAKIDFQTGFRLKNSEVLNAYK